MLRVAVVVFFVLALCANHAAESVEFNGTDVLENGTPIEPVLVPFDESGRALADLKSRTCPPPGDECARQLMVEIRLYPHNITEIRRRHDENLKELMRIAHETVESIAPLVVVEQKPENRTEQASNTATSLDKVVCVFCILFFVFFVKFVYEDVTREREHRRLRKAQ